MGAKASMSGSPDIDDGYLRIANELFDAILVFPFTKRQLAVLLAVVRKTYGYRKTSDDISLSQLAELTGIGRSHCSTTINELVQMGILIKFNGKYGQVIAIQKHYKNWKVLPNQEHPQAVTETGTPCSQNGNIAVTNLGTTKDNSKKQSPKDNSQQPAKQVREAPKREKKNPICLKTYLDNCKAEEKMPVPPDDPIFDYAEKAQIPEDWLHLCWREFVERHIDSGKRQKSWPQTFRNCVKSNWYRLWFITADNEYRLTTAGRQAEIKHNA